MKQGLHVRTMLFRLSENHFVILHRIRIGSFVNQLHGNKIGCQTTRVFSFICFSKNFGSGHC